MRKLFNSVIYTFFANIVTILATSVITFVLPKKMGAVEYGYVQLYLFYANYTGFLHLGWADGIYLKYGGTYYDKIDRKVFSGQFWLYSAIECFLGVLIGIAGGIFISPQEKATVLAFTGMAIGVYLPRTLLQYILQSTNRIREYSITLVIDRIIYLLMVLIIVQKKNFAFCTIFLADLIGKAGSLTVALYFCKSIVFTWPDRLINIINEAKNNIFIGSRLMFANVASMLIIGIIRLSIENKWDIETFGKISLTMSVSSLFMILINAVAMVMFPALRRSDQKSLSNIYIRIRPFLIISMLGMLTFYYPVKNILSFWLPQYVDSLRYMAILFPMCLFECKMSLLVTTYMKTLRKEKWLMQVNIITLIISFLCTLINVYVLENLDLTVLSVVILLGFRSVVAEIILSRELDIDVHKINIEEIFLSLIFMCSSWFIQGWVGLMVYLFFYVIYLVCHKETLRSMVKEIKQQY